MTHFWETEKVPEVFREYTSEQEACESLFQDSLQIIDDQYQVKLPLKQIAIKRFQFLEKRFNRNPKLYFQYQSFINEYLKLNHAKIVDYNKDDLNNGSIYFMAHHPVIREDKNTTKLRVVFDGIMKSKAFLATRCLVELAPTKKVQFPLALKDLLNNTINILNNNTNTYVDDILTGSDTIEDAINLKHELISSLNLRSFSLHK
ncbi:hypothetical protein YQE_08946, partial [Dendroctonus ponderosae]